MSEGIGVLVEDEFGRVSPQSLALLEVARPFSAKMARPLWTFSLSPMAPEDLSLIGAFGVREHFQIPSPEGGIDELGRRFASFWSSRGESLVLCGDTPRSVAALAWAAASLGHESVFHVESVDFSGPSVVLAKKALANEQMAKITYVAGSAVIGLAAKGSPGPHDEGPSPAVRIVEAEAAVVRIQVVHQEPQMDLPSLGHAETIVCGGMGLKTKANFGVLEQLARRLGGAVGATRPAVDSGFLPHECQIGLTGKSVSPRIYWGLGVSGALHHMAGIRGSRTIVAINTDAEAPLFRECDYGIVGDAVEVAHSIIQRLDQEGESQ